MLAPRITLSQNEKGWERRNGGKYGENIAQRVTQRVSQASQRQIRNYERRKEKKVGKRMISGMLKKEGEFAPVIRFLSGNVKIRKVGMETKTHICLYISFFRATAAHAIIIIN
jgi:hypothetical protein